MNKAASYLSLLIWEKKERQSLDLVYAVSQIYVNAISCSSKTRHYPSLWNNEKFFEDRFILKQQSTIHEDIARRQIEFKMLLGLAGDILSSASITARQ